jgi:hypothetical protein
VMTWLHTGGGTGGEWRGGRLLTWRMPWLTMAWVMTVEVVVPSPAFMSDLIATSCKRTASRKSQLLDDHEASR